MKSVHTPFKIAVSLGLTFASLGFSEHAETPKSRSQQRTVTKEMWIGDKGPNAEDPCLEKLSQEAEKERASTSIRGQEQKKATQARIFLDFVNESKTKHDYSEASAEKKFFYFLDVLSGGDPLHDERNVWHAQGGMNMPQNYQNLVTTLQRFPKAEDQKSQRDILSEAVNHLGWLTSSNFHVPPLRGSSFTDNRYLYDYAKDWLRCISSAPATPARVKPPEEENPLTESVPTAPEVGQERAAPEVSQEREAASQAVQFYENGMRYRDGNPRERFPADTFKDIPSGGTGQLVLAYFGPKDRALEEAAKNHPLIQVRNYPLNSPEHREAKLFGTQALALDGLGRKITRYAMSPREALQSLASGSEVSNLQKYLDAKRVLASE